MSKHSRRAMLGAFLGGATGGLLLPWQGRGGLILPDKAAAAKLPVIATNELPFSAECLQLREMERELRKYCVFDGSTRLSHDEAQRRYRSLLEEHNRLASIIHARPPTTWGQCVELAEISWSLSVKTEARPWRGEHDGTILHNVPENYRDWMYTWACSPRLVRANAYLIDAVLSMGGGARYDWKLGRQGIAGRPIHG